MDLRLPLVAEPAAAAAARRAVREWLVVQDQQRCDDAVQVASELVANSVRHGPDGGRIWMTLEGDGERLRIEVRDEGLPQEIARRAPRTSGPFAGGRGLLLVDLLSEEWGTSSEPTRVWAVLTMPGTRG